MSNQTPFSIRIFVVDGDPDGLRTIERSNWNGKGIMFPRALYTHVRNRSEFEQPGVYLLIGPRTDGDGEMLYIGEGDPVKQRFEEHYADRDFWTRTVFFVAGSGQLHKAHIQFLEAQLISRAKAAKRMPLDNIKNSNEPTLSDADRAEMNEFLHIILGMLPVLGVQAFEQPVGQGMNVDAVLLHCSGRGVDATGYDTPQGFMIRADSCAAIDEVPSLKEYSSNVVELRADLLKNGVLERQGQRYRFTQDYTFNSPSLASAVVLARPSNGRTDWKDETGMTLKELQEAQAHN